MPYQDNIEGISSPLKTWWQQCWQTVVVALLYLSLLQQQRRHPRLPPPIVLSLPSDMARKGLFCLQLGRTHQTLLHSVWEGCWTSRQKHMCNPHKPSLPKPQRRWDQATAETHGNVAPSTEIVRGGGGKSNKWEKIWAKPTVGCNVMVCQSWCKTAHFHFLWPNLAFSPCVTGST